MPCLTRTQQVQHRAAELPYRQWSVCSYCATLLPFIRPTNTSTPGSRVWETCATAHRRCKNALRLGGMLCTAEAAYTAHTHTALPNTRTHARTHTHTHTHTQRYPTRTQRYPTQFNPRCINSCIARCVLRQWGLKYNGVKTPLSCIRDVFWLRSPAPKGLGSETCFGWDRWHQRGSIRVP